MYLYIYTKVFRKGKASRKGPTHGSLTNGVTSSLNQWNLWAVITVSSETFEQIASMCYLTTLKRLRSLLF